MKKRVNLSTYLLVAVLAFNVFYYISSKLVSREITRLSYENMIMVFENGYFRGANTQKGVDDFDEFYFYYRQDSVRMDSLIRGF